MNIYVGNMPFSMTEAQLNDAFSAHGEVSSARLATDRDSGRPRGFGFVEMNNAEEANKAIAALNGVEFEGRALVVNEAKPREDRAPRPRGNDNRRPGGGRNRW